MVTRRGLGVSRTGARHELLIAPFGNDYRVRLATAWMNEEWYNDRIRTGSDPNWVCTSFLSPSKQPSLPFFFLRNETDADCSFVGGGRRCFFSDLIMIFGLIRS